jgi:hypothetical protein
MGGSVTMEIVRVALLGKPLFVFQIVGVALEMAGMSFLPPDLGFALTFAAAFFAMAGFLKGGRAGIRWEPTSTIGTTFPGNFHGSHLLP